MADMEPMLPIIDVIQAQMQTAYEDEVLRAVQKVGVIVDKERLMQALTTARKFYEEGYRAAMNGADVVEVVRCKDCKHYISAMSLCTQENGVGDVRDKMDFCSCGERWDEA